MTVEDLERALMRDLQDVHERFEDERFCGELYRALARTKLSKPEAGEGHLALSFTQAEGLVNELRGRRGSDDLTLAQTGGEGEVSSTVRDVLGGRGWHFAPLDTGANDPLHDHGDRQPPPEREDGGRWAAEAHAEADREIRRKTP